MFVIVGDICHMGDRIISVIIPILANTLLSSPLDQPPFNFDNKSRRSAVVIKG
jgi:hypothetical protein